MPASLKPSKDSGASWPMRAMLLAKVPVRTRICTPRVACRSSKRSPPASSMTAATFDGRLGFSGRPCV